MCVKYLKKIKTDYLLQFLKIIHVIQIIFFWKFSYKPYYIFICWDIERNIIKRTQQKFYLMLIYRLTYLATFTHNKY